MRDAHEAKKLHNSNQLRSSHVPYWRLWFACCLGFGAIGMTMQVISGYAQERLCADAVVAGLTVTIGSLATMISRPLSGRMADQRGGRLVAMFGAMLSMIGGAAHLVSINLPILIAARLLLGAGEGALFTGSVGWILSRTEQTRRGKAAGHFGLAMWMGLACGPLLGSMILSLGSYRSVWMTAGILPLFSWILVASTRPDCSAFSAKNTKVRRSWIPEAARIPGASGVFSSIGYGVIAAFLVPRFTAMQFVGRPLALTVFGVAFIVTRFWGSGLASRLGGRRVLFAAFLIESAGLGGLALSHSAWLAFLSTSLTGAGLSLLIPSVTSLVTEAAKPHERTAAVGAVTSAWDLGVALGGPLGGLVAGKYMVGPFALAAVAALTAIVPLAIRRHEGREEFCTE